MRLLIDVVLGAQAAALENAIHDEDLDEVITAVEEMCVALIQSLR
jgi:hypothetical protein